VSIALFLTISPVKISLRPLFH